MYYNFTVQIPSIKGKVLTKDKGTTTYILYQYGLDYNSLTFRLKDVPSPFLGITAIYCFVYFINNYILCFLTHFNVLVLNSF